MAKQEEIGAGPGEMMGNAGPGMLAGLRVIEVADDVVFEKLNDDTT